jgi:phosphate transport system substrate-binding protein
MAAVAALALAAAAMAQDVTLTSRDGTLTFSGTLEGYDGSFYRVVTEYGAMTVDGETVICEGPGCPDLTARFDDLLVVGEAESAERLLPALFRAFAAARGNRMIRRVEKGAAVVTLLDVQGAPVARVRFSAMPPEAARQALTDGLADMAILPLADPSLNAQVLGQEALVAAVAPDNPLPGLGTRDLARALAGEVANWAELGGPDIPLVIHATAPETGARRAVEARLGQPIVAGAEHPSLAALAETVARDPYALAILPAGAAGAARVLPLTDSCGFALAAGSAAVKAGDYPLALPVYLLTPRRRPPLILREFAEFLATPAAAAAAATAGLIDRAPGRAALTGDGQRLANAIRAAGPEVTVADLQRLVTAMAGAERLTPTFRFEGGSPDLDPASESHLVDLVRLIDAGIFAGQEIVFAGFSDGSGAAAANLDLSRRRAEQVRAAVAAALAEPDAVRTTLSVEAFGEALPMACDESPLGRRINRRVEVWLRPLAAADPP